jgi:hypothetical protein
MKTQRKGIKLERKKLNLCDDQLTNDKLIKMLKKFPGDLPVWHEGCNCYGAANKVVYDAGVGGLLIKRSE